ncbi:MAG: glycoside hydrolase family 127 protein [Clostridia bacterium]|nr:glycoside hydrolase family 127 protein [Clostridia bacterium]
MKPILNAFKTYEIAPRGWMKKQLEIQAESLSGQLYKVWRDVRDSKWIGGDAEGWERVPYWLDGFIPLAFLLRDEEKIAVAKKYVDAILAGQAEDGWICPCTEEERSSYDMWGLILLTKVLVVWHGCTDDERIEPALRRALRNFYDRMKAGTTVVDRWAKARWFETFFALTWLEAQGHEDWIGELAQMLHDGGADYLTFEEKWKVPLNKWTFETHVVNAAMAVKGESAGAELRGLKNDAIPEKIWRTLMKYNGMAAGIFTGDECLSGLSPVQGCELCAVVELMFSMETLGQVFGKTAWFDRLEKVAFNAFPATISEDMWSHQYVQLSNQIACERFWSNPPFRTNGKEANIFGLEPNFGCCTANFNQGWPKLVLSAFARSARGIASCVFVPAEVNTEVNGVPVRVVLDTYYPYRDKLTYTVCAQSPVTFDLDIRVPAFAQTMTVDGEAVAIKRGFYTVHREWSGESRVEVELTFAPKLVNRPHDLRTAEYGPLVFSLKVENKKRMLEYVRNGVDRTFPYCDWELSPVSEWQYGFADGALEVVEHELQDSAFAEDAPMLTLRANLARVNWGYRDGFDNVCAKTPKSRKAISEPISVELVPYGCAKLRMTEMPMVRK